MSFHRQKPRKRPPYGPLHAPTAPLLRPRYAPGMAPEPPRHLSAAVHAHTPLGPAGDARTKTTSFSPKTHPEPTRPVHGTDPQTGRNPHDASHGTQMHSATYLALRPAHSAVDTLKNYKVAYDPELDRTLSKAERKQRHRKLHFQSECAERVPTDPRAKLGITTYLAKPNKLSKKMPFKQLPQARFVYDKDSLGAPPQTELVVWDLPPTISEVYLVNFLQSFGDTVRDMKFINDPVNAVPLGIATFCFQGSLEKALRTAKKFLRAVQTECPKVDGVPLRIGLNDEDNRLLNAKVKVAQGKLRVDRIKREAEEKRLLEIKKKKEEAERAAEKLDKHDGPDKHDKQPEPAPTHAQRNTTTKSYKHKNKVVQGTFLPHDLVRYVKDRPYIYINDKYLPTREISSQEVKKFLMKYDWTRVLLDKTGYYVVFNSLKECERCFYKEDGARFFEYRMHMELCVPEKFDENNVQTSTSKGNDLVDEAVNSLIKDFQTFLSKDIRERIIAPIILDLLNPENYPELVSELKKKEEEKEAEKARLREQQKVKSEVGKPANDTYSFFSEKKKESRTNNHVLTLPSFTKKLGALSNRNKRKNLFPMQHALNYDDQDSEDSDDDDTSRSATPVPLKREAGSTTSPEEESPRKKHKTSKLRETFLYDDDSSDEEMDEDGRQELDKDDDAHAADVPQVDSKYSSTQTPLPVDVYEPIEPRAGSLFDLTRLQEILRDDEDMALARELLAEELPSVIKHPEYWAWKQKQSTSAIISEEESIGVFSDRLECETGSFKSEGFRKIADADKIEYLPHRRKIHKPLKTVQHDSEEQSGSTNTNNANNLQSSRVNRANNRRFAADISAQKQILSSESDILNLNALNKRKKPVSFARSAIHNWGLYALEPIAAKEMIIEYVGESIRQQVAEHREKSYLRTGIGSSYLFRIDENTVIDATKKGGIARFINHCCNPSCTAKIIKVDGKKRIVIYALRDIDANEELTYDYKFERETNDDERIRCLCGAPGCKGYLN